MSAPHIIFDSLLSLCQKLPHLVEVWRCLFSATRCIAYLPGFLIDHPNGLAYATVLRLSAVVCTEYMYIMAG